jgi:hypothetical protein
MGRGIELVTFYEVKIRIPGDRRLSNGRKTEGGEIISKLIEANKPDHARTRCRGIGQILSIRRVKKDDVIGNIESMGLQDIIGRPLKERRFDAITDNSSLDELLFGSRKRKERER